MKVSDVLLRLIGAKHLSCPNEIDVLAYTEDRLSRLGRSQLEQHFATCEDCRELLAVLGREPVEAGPPPPDKAVAEQTQRILNYIQEDERKRSGAARQSSAAAHSYVSSPKLAAGGFVISYPKLATLSLAVSAIAVTGVLLFTMRGAPADDAMQALKLAVKDARFTQARVSGGLEYSRYSATRGADNHHDDLQFSRALNKLKSAEQETAPVNDRIVLARVYLSRDKLEDTKHALVILTQLAARGVESAEVLNDTGVAQVQLNNYNDAISYFSRALAKAPGYGEALFNRALAEVRAHRDEEAKRDWRQFINQTSDENWKAEARQHLNSLGGDSER